MTVGRVRQPAVAGQFYEASPEALRRAVADCTRGYEAPADLAEPLGGIVPHAGWMFSGPTAGKVFLTLAEKAQPDIYVILGAVHRWGVDRPSVYPAGVWRSPLGDALVDAELADALVQAGRGKVLPSTDAHEGEHSIEVQIPFVQALSPEAAIMPVAVPPLAEAVPLGEWLAEVIDASSKKVVVVASTDLTHYGMGYGVPAHGRFPEAKPWMDDNDKRIIKLAEDLMAEGICREAAQRHNACGAGAMAAAVSNVRARGATSGRVLEYTTSAEVMHETETDRAVGYVGMVFEKAAEAT